MTISPSEYFFNGMVSPGQFVSIGIFAAGVIGGIAAGALIAGAARPYGYGAYGYAPAPVYGPPCYWQRQRFWDGYGWRMRRIWVCG